jgi:hypothetical protein
MRHSVSKMIWIRIRKYILYLCIFVDLEGDTAEFITFVCNCIQVLKFRYVNAWLGLSHSRSENFRERNLLLVPAGKRIIIPRLSNPWRIFYTD